VASTDLLGASSRSTPALTIFAVRPTERLSRGHPKPLARILDLQQDVPRLSHYTFQTPIRQRCPRRVTLAARSYRRSREKSTSAGRRTEDVTLGHDRSLITKDRTCDLRGCLDVRRPRLDVGYCWVVIKFHGLPAPGEEMVPSKEPLVTPVT
jgi:hypothetical protein